MTIGWVSELIALGRLRVSRPTPRSTGPPTETRTSSFSSTECNVVRRPGSERRRVRFPVKDLGRSFSVAGTGSASATSLSECSSSGRHQHRRGTDGARKQQPGISFLAQGAGWIRAVRYRSRRLRAAGGTGRSLRRRSTPTSSRRAVARPLTIDDVVTKTGITLGVVTVVGVISYFLVSQNAGLMMPFVLVGALGGLALVLIATFGRKQDNPAIVLSYAALRGPVPRRGLVPVRQPGVHRWPGDDRAGDSSAPSACSSACSSSTRPAPSASRRSSPA